MESPKEPLSDIVARIRNTPEPRRMIRHGEYGLIHEFSANCTGCRAPRQYHHSEVPPCYDWRGNRYDWNVGWEHDQQMRLYGSCRWCGAEVF